MFTGLVGAVGSLRALTARGGDLRMEIGYAGLPGGPLALGESIAVNGVCLTVVAFDADVFTVDASNETLSLTTLGALAPGAALNLERALLPTTRLGGHLVAGHVDGIGSIASIAPDARSQRWRIAAPAALLRYVAAKGSICMDGVSLTVNAVDDAGFEVNLIPHTLQHTRFGDARVGESVNLEVDLMARYAERLLAPTGGGA
jgi:riboflavin synthase